MQNMKMIANFLLAKTAEEYRHALLAELKGNEDEAKHIEDLEKFFRSSTAKRLAVEAGSNSSPVNIIREFRRVSADEIPSVWELLEKSLGIYSAN